MSVSLYSRNSLKVYPSLAQKGDVLRLETNGNTAIDVMDMNGKIVKRIAPSVKSTGQNATIETINIGTDALHSGRYFVRCVGNTLVQTASFIVL